MVGPARPGFGGQLIDFTISHEFGGIATINYTATGVVCDIAIPWEKVARRRKHKAKGDPGRNRRPPCLRLELPSR